MSGSKFAVMDKLPSIFMVIEDSTLLEFPVQPEKIKPGLGVAVTVTEDPFTYSPPTVLTEPPSDEFTIKVYFWIGGVISTSSVESGEQELIIISSSKEINL